MNKRCVTAGLLGALLSFFIYAVCISPCYAKPAVSGLVGYWPLDGPDISGNAAIDRSGQNYNGTIVGAKLAIGKIGQALRFNGSNDAVNVNDPGGPNSLDTPNAVTISAWVNIGESVNDYMTFASKGGNYWLGYYAGQWMLTFDSGGWQNLFGGSFETNTWYHVVGIIDSTNNYTRIYVNGQLIAENLNQTADMVVNNNALQIGDTTTYPSLIGSVDEVRVYNIALPEAAVKRLYNMGQGMRTAAPQQAKLTNGLVGYWPFNGPDISGTIAYDRSGNSYNGTITGATLTIGKLGQGISFNGNGNLISIPSVPDLPAMTVSMWINIPVFLTTKRVFDREAYSPLFRTFVNGSFQFVGDVFLGGVGTLNPNEWYHVVITGGSAGHTIYINGALNAYDPTAYTVSNTSDVWIGGGVDDFLGKIDEFRIYDRVLAVSEVKELYSQGASIYQASQQNPLTTGLVGYWPFNGADISGNTAYDRSGEGNNGTLTAATLTIGKIGQALSFTQSSCIVPHSSELNITGAITISAWVKPYLFAGSYVAFVEKTYYGSSYFLGTDTGTGNRKLAFWYGNTQVIVSNTDVLTLNQWQHVAVSYTGSGADLYLDGVNIKHSDTTATVSGNSSALWIGYRADVDRNLNGALDEVRIYNRALSANEIKRLYNMGR